MAEHKLEIIDSEADFPETLGLSRERSDELLEAIFELTKTEEVNPITTTWMMSKASELAESEVELAFVAYSVGVAKAFVGQANQEAI